MNIGSRSVFGGDFIADLNRLKAEATQAEAQTQLNRKKIDQIVDHLFESIGVTVNDSLSKERLLFTGILRDLDASTTQADREKIIENAEKLANKILKTKGIEKVDTPPAERKEKMGKILLAFWNAKAKDVASHPMIVKENEVVNDLLNILDIKTEFSKTTTQAVRDNLKKEKDHLAKITYEIGLCKTLGEVEKKLKSAGKEAEKILDNKDVIKNKKEAPNRAEVITKFKEALKNNWIAMAKPEKPTKVATTNEPEKTKKEPKKEDIDPPTVGAMKNARYLSEQPQHLISKEDTERTALSILKKKNKVE